MLNPQERGQVEALMRALQQRKAAINNDPNLNLSAEDRRELGAREQLRAEAALRQLLEQSDARHQRAVKDAYYRSFGLKETSADQVLADRDARQYAEALTGPQAALKSLAAAELRGDVSLARAIAERAWQERAGDVDGGWQQVLTAYAGADPARNRSLGALAELVDAPTDRLYRNLPREADLQRGSIEQLAANADAKQAAFTAGA